MLGVEFQSSRSMSVNDGEFFRLGRDGDMYLSVINMARTKKGVDLEKQFNEFNNPYLDFRQLKIIDEAYTDYKKSTNKIDFVDMIENFIDSPDCPKLDLLIVDEAQDLVPLRWKWWTSLSKTQSRLTTQGMMTKPSTNGWALIQTTLSLVVQANES